VRSIVFTGRGGSGVSTLAAATAVALAAGGRKTLAFGLGRGLAAAFGKPLGPHPTLLNADLWGLEATRPSHDEPGPFLDWLRDLFLYRDMDETVADDIAALPGLVEIGCLLTLEERIESDDYDAAVVDLPALQHALDLLSALDSAARALERLFPERAPTVLDPFLRALSTQANDGEAIYNTGRALLQRLSRLRDALSADSASVRLVCAADKASVSEAQRAVTELSLFAYPVDAAFCNRLYPADSGDWSKPRRKDEKAALAEARESLAPLPVLPVPLAPRDVSGLDGLAALAAQAYGDADAGAVLRGAPASAGGFERRDGSYVLSLALPFVERDALAIERLSDVVVVHVGDRSRTFDLPAEVRGLANVSSAFDGETLRVTFGA
jgi:arsenite-transporting ATPase